MIQDSLFALPVPPIPAGIELIRGDSSLAIARARELGGARLVVADPPWGQYQPGSNGQGQADPEQQYPVLSLDAIADHLDAAARALLPGGRLVVWHCWPLLAEALGASGPWARVLRPGGLPAKTGGSWNKTQATPGVGYHWLGHSEPVLVYCAPGVGVRHPKEGLRSGWCSDAANHSAKPEAWMRGWLRRWTEPGDVVLDLYAGLGGVARACRAEGRRYVGAEIDPDRHAAALAFIAQNREIA